MGNEERYQEVKFLKLSAHDHGRRIAYRELGCTDGTATKSLLALHGMMSTSLGAMPGVSEQTLRDYGVRLVAIDRPGYGRSDPDQWQTLYSTVKDMEQVMDALGMGKKVWLLGVSMGGAFCWAAARYIPHRIAGITMWSPVGSLSWKGMTSDDRHAILSSYTFSERLFTYLAKLCPFVAFEWYAKYLSYDLSSGPSKDITKSLSAEDWDVLYKPEVEEQMTKDYIESLRYFKGFGVAKDLQLLLKNWGFELDDIAKVYMGKIHIWQGDKDRLVPLRFQQWVQMKLPNTIILHELLGEGHLSWYCFNDKAHRQTLETLFAT